MRVQTQVVAAPAQQARRESSVWGRRGRCAPGESSSAPVRDSEPAAPTPCGGPRCHGARGPDCCPPHPPQGALQETSSEHLRLSDRSSLLSEIQALRAQLRRTHLQNQEKLQQLCAALTSTEARGSRREHQLRRQGGWPRGRL